LKITLPTQGFADIATMALNIQEEDKDENIGDDGIVYSVTASFNTDSEAQIALTDNTANMSNSKMYATLDDSKIKVGYIESAVSSQIFEDSTTDQTSLKIIYPGEETYADLYIGSKASKVTSTAGAEGTAVTKIEVGAAVMDTSLASYTSQNLIVVGGPAINRAAAALLGKTYPAYGVDSGIAENTGMIKLVESAGKVALIVAGWEADDTQRASRVLAEYDNYDALSGKELVVTGTSMTDISVGIPTVAAAPETVAATE